MLIVPEYVLNAVHSGILVTVVVPAGSYMAMYLVYLFVFVHEQNNVKVLCRSLSVIN